MSLRKIDYKKLRESIMGYLYHNKSEKKGDYRTSTSLKMNFGVSEGVINKALYELKGMGFIERFYLGKNIVWLITKKGKEYLNEKKVLSDDDE